MKALLQRVKEASESVAEAFKDTSGCVGPNLTTAIALSLTHARHQDNDGVLSRDEFVEGYKQYFHTTDANTGDIED